jgi:hypothetical protein
LTAVGFFRTLSDPLGDMVEKEPPADPGRVDLQPTLGCSRVVEPDPEARFREQVSNAGCPFDDDDRIRRQHVFDPEVQESIGAAQAISIDVDQGYAPLFVAVNDRIGRAADRSPRDVEPAPDPAGEDGLAGPEVPIERQDVSGLKETCELPAERLCVFG